MLNKNVKRISVCAFILSALILYNLNQVITTKIKKPQSQHDNLEQLSSLLYEAQRIIDILKTTKLADQLEPDTFTFKPDVITTTTARQTIHDPRNPDWISLFEIKNDIKIWIDVPNDFPWRKCLLDYNGRAATSECVLNGHLSSTWTITGYPNSRSNNLQIFNQGRKKCLEPEFKTFRTGMNPNNLVITDCTEGKWIYTAEGHLEWTVGEGEGERGCFTTLGYTKGNAVVLDKCDPKLQEQKVEFGYVENLSAGPQLKPLHHQNWELRQNEFRETSLKAARVSVEEALSFKIAARTNENKRRAVVFYLDKGKGFLAHLQWWIEAWKLLGLNSEKEKFDLVLFSHPESIQHIPAQCVTYSDDLNLTGPGLCFYVPLYGISYRDSTYDKYINSHECLVSVNSSFLQQYYSHLLRSDMDTFPTPQIVNFWPERLLANKYMAYTFRNSSGISKITEELKDTARSLGLVHQGWHDIGSSWFGDAHRVIKLSKLTVSLSKYIKHYMFGAGTHCRCATCHKLPDDCQWGSGPYAGTLLLYAQELAMNVLWTKEEFDSMVKGYLDHGTTTLESVCEMLHLHIFHNAEPFSKFRFHDGAYKSENITGVDVSLVRHYAMYLALRSSGQGVGVDEVTKRFNLTYDGAMSNMCADKNYGIFP